MPPKRSKGKKLDVEFAGPDPAGKMDLAWAEDAWNPEPAEGEGKVEGGGDKRDNQRKPKHEFNFRDDNNRPDDSYVDPNSSPPYVAYIGNIPNKLTADELKDELEKKCSIGTIKKISLNTRGASTFAYVEVETVDFLIALGFANGMFVQGRKLKISPATEEQKKRMVDKPTRDGGFAPGFSREDMGGERQANFPGGGRMRQSESGGNLENLSRDIFGSGDQTRAGAGQPQGEISRDALFGSAEATQQPTLPGRGAGFPRSASGGNTEGNWRNEGASAQPQPPSPGRPAGPPADFADWRNTEKVEQPDWRNQNAEVGAGTPEARGGRGRGRGGGAWKRGGGRGGAGGPKQEENWRDVAEPAAKAEGRKDEEEKEEQHHAKEEHHPKPKPKESPPPASRDHHPKEEQHHAKEKHHGKEKGHKDEEKEKEKGHKKDREETKGHHQHEHSQPKKGGQQQQQRPNAGGKGQQQQQQQSNANKNPFEILRR